MTVPEPVPGLVDSPLPARSPSSAMKLPLLAVPTIVLGGEDFAVITREHRREIGAVDAIARGERAVKHAVEMVAGDVLYRELPLLESRIVNR